MSSPAPTVIAELARSYQDQFITTAETLKRRGQGLAANAPKDADQLKSFVHSEVEPAVMKKQAELVAVITDSSDVPSTVANIDTFKFLLETYGWVAICLFGAGLGSLVGGLLLSPIIELVLSNFLAVVLAYVVIPYYFYVSIRSDTTMLADEKRMMLFYMSVVVGVLNGHNLSLCYSASFAPPSFITPLVIALVAELAGTKVAPSRPPVLGACIGTAVVVHLILGVASGSMGAAYLFSTILEGGIAFAGLQYTLSAIKSGDGDMVTLQFVQVVTSIVLGALGTYLTGMTKEDANATTERQNAEK